VTLVDLPLVSPDTVRAVVRAWQLSRAPIVRPAQGDRHGHPVIFDRAVFADLRAADLAVGAKAVFARHRAGILDVDVDDPGSFDDLDTPEDYARACASRMPP
jgi:molybdenum cofactor cytidylyltransferase